LIRGLPGFNSVCAIVDNTLIKEDKNGLMNSTFMLGTLKIGAKVAI
jgi:hypothetical protein